MQRTDRMWNLIAVILFLAMLAYLGSSLLHAAFDGVVTAESTAADLSPGAAASGLVLRRERVLTAPDAAAYTFVTAAEGSRVPAGAVLALSVRSRQSRESLERLRALEAEAETVSAALRRVRTAGDAADRELAAGSAARDLASATARHDLTALNSAALHLETLLIGTGEGVSAERLSALELELDQLRGSLSGEAEELTTPVAGTFSARTDGYEHLTLSDLEDLSPSRLRSLAIDRREPVSGTYGKVVEDYRWYFAAVMDAADTGTLAPGVTVALNFGHWYGEDVYARTLSVSPPEEGTVAVVFQCDTALAETLSLRNVNATVVFGSYSGVRLPSQAIRTDPETEQTYVWTVTALRLERRDVEILYAGEDYAIVRRDSAAGALREGETVVVSGRNLYEGKVMG